jgi:hypothetical protein
VKRVAAMLLFLVVVLVTGCDPGFTVRQLNARPQWQSAVPEIPQQVSVEVSKFHALIGSGYYTPKIRVISMAKLSVEIMGVELVTSRGIYPVSPRQNEESPVKIDSGATREIDVWFELHDGLLTTFKEPAALYVHYIIGNRNETATAKIVGKVEAVSGP